VVDEPIDPPARYLVIRSTRRTVLERTLAHRPVPRAHERTHAGGGVL